MRTAQHHPHLDLPQRCSPQPNPDTQKLKRKIMTHESFETQAEYLHMTIYINLSCSVYLKTTANLIAISK